MCTFHGTLQVLWQKPRTFSLKFCHSDYRTNDDSVSENLYSPVFKGSHPFPGKEEGCVRGGVTIVGKDLEESRKERETVI